MNGLFYLGHLVYLKNQLNRKRRRFWHLMNPGQEVVRITKGQAFHHSSKMVHEHTNYQGNSVFYLTIPKPSHPLYSIVEARAGYEAAKLDMKSMTAHMREVCKELGAKFQWDSTGNIHALVMDGKRYTSKDITHLHEAYLADEILLA